MNKLIRKSIVIAFLLVFTMITPVSAANINVPFTSQAPFADWREPWQNACEEAAIVMLNNYYSGKSLTKEQARDQILQVIQQKEALYGFSLDESTDKMVGIINNYSPFSGKKVSNPSVVQMKAEIDKGHPVIIPVYSSNFNPHFKTGNPFYHVIILSGYDDAKKEFISQEPGTRYGQNYRYSYSRIMSAIHDFIPGQTANGAKNAIFTDGNAIKIPAPQVRPPESKINIPQRSIIKSDKSPKLFLYVNGYRFYITNLEALQNNAPYSGRQVISEVELNKIPQGEDLVR